MWALLCCLGRWLVAAWDRLVYRAWISTIIIGILIVLFYFNDQTREILAGLSETMDMAARGQLNPGFRWSGIVAYGAFWGSSFALAMALALVVCVTAERKHEGGIGRPQADQASIGMAAIAWAGVVFVATLLVIHLAFATERMGAAGQALVRVAIFSVMMLALMGPSFWIWRRGARGWSIAVALMMLAAAAICLALFGIGGGDSIAGLVLSSATPALAALSWIVLCSCRSLSRLAWRRRLVMLITVLTLLVLAPWGPTVVWAVGSIPVALLFLAWAACALGCCLLAFQWLHDRFGLRSDIVAVIVVAVVVFVAWHEKIGREKLRFVDLQQATGQPGKGAVRRAAALDQPQQVAAHAPSDVQLAIHADGGGLRAALFTAAVLAYADDLTCGDFGSHLFAASGVSGGSLGIATWAVMRQEYIRKTDYSRKANVSEKTDAAEVDPWGSCKARRDDKGQPTIVLGERTPLADLVSSTLVLDHLSTALAAMLRGDLLTPTGDAGRGQALLDSWQGAALGVLAFGEKESPWRQAFSATLKDVTAGLDRPPLLMFTSTDADTGARVVFSNAPWRPADQLNSLSIGAAALHSARFPGISPAGAVFDGTWKRVVDGGYFDNSGAATLREMLFEAKGRGAVPETGKVVVARINGNSPDDNRCAPFFRLLKDTGQLPDNIRLPRRLEGGPPPASASVRDKTLPAFDGWSATDAFWAARYAHADEAVRSLCPRRMPALVSEVFAPLIMDTRWNFNPRCVRYLEEKQRGQDQQQALQAGAPPDRALAECLLVNQQICYRALTMRPAPLGWYFSWGAARPIQEIAFTAALRLTDRMFGKPPAERQGWWPGVARLRWHFSGCAGRN